MKPNMLRIAIVGSGPSALYVLANVRRLVGHLKDQISRIEVFESGRCVGVGMPYSSDTTDIKNLCNISSEEIPKLSQPFTDWLRGCSDVDLERWSIEREFISSSETYPRVALGEYFHAQWNELADQLRSYGIAVIEWPSTTIVDVVDNTASNTVRLIASPEQEFEFDRVIIATGHAFAEPDDESNGFYASPWPMQKLMPKSSEKHRYSIGTLGASLSAFDVIASQAYRHGTFTSHGRHLRFTLDPAAKGFRLVMHSAKGWLPHLQYEQREAFRDIYRHVGRDALLALRDARGFISLDRYFDHVCRPALAKAFRRDQRADMVDLISDQAFTLENFVERMTDEHSYEDAFKGMQLELEEAEKALEDNRPMHWKEVLDDLMYTLNYHAEFLPAEDHLRFHATVMSFLMNVIAALPLQSARILLALYDAGVLELVSGYVQAVKKQYGETVVAVSGDDGPSTHHYRVFVDCSGQTAQKLDDFPFKSLVRQGVVRSARVAFADGHAIQGVGDEDRERVIQGDVPMLELAGIDIDGFFRVIDESGQANTRIHDIAFPHTAGKRPHSYGLQSCNDTAAILVESWTIHETGSSPASDHKVSEVYARV